MTREEYKEIYAKGYADGQKALTEHIELCKEEQELKVGHWDNSFNYPDIAWTCSECKHFTTMKHNYCPHCGVRMSEVNNEKILSL